MFGGGGLVAKLCLTLSTQWTVACQTPLSIRGQAQAGIGVRRAAWDPGPQVCGLLEAHPDLAARGLFQPGAPPWSALRHPALGARPSVVTPPKSHTSSGTPLPLGFQSHTPGTAAGAPTAGHPQVQMPHYPTPAAPEWRHENADRCVGTLCLSEPSPRRQQVHGGADLPATGRPPSSRPCETGRHAPQSTSQATAFLWNLCGSPWPEPPLTFVCHLPCGEGPCLCPGQTKSPWGQSWPPSLAPELPRPWPTGSWVPASHQVGGGGEPSGAQDHSLLVSGPLPAAPTVAAADSAEQAGCKEGARYDGSSHECPAEPWGGAETA